MFEFFFKYPASVFARGRFVLLGSWPRWILYAAIAAAALLLAGALWRKRSRVLPSFRHGRALVISLLQWTTLAILLLLLWEPAISVTTLKPQQNIVAVVLDDSRSMALADDGEPRAKQAADLLNSKLLKGLRSRFQVRLYRLGGDIERIETPNQLHGDQSSTQIGRGLRELANEAATLPIGSIVLMSDGADNSGGIDSDTVTEMRRRRIPINTIGFGREKLADDVELESFEIPAKTLEASRLQAQVTLRQNGFGGKHARLVVTGGGAVLANREIVLRNTSEQTETVEFSAGKAGVK
nr:VWA domain-containing protein [Acidobacteriota bacterium]